MIKLMVACALLVVGCADLETFSQPCGNFEIDEGEDCDEGAEPTERCNSCRLVCDSVRTCHGFADYSCGVDGYCRAPSGRLASTFTELATLAKTFAITDIDRDLYADVISVSGTSLTVNYGDALGGLSFQVSTLIPSVFGEPIFTDIDGDQTTDVVVPTADGIAAYSSPYSVLSPHSFVLGLDPDVCPLSEKLLGQPFHVFSLDDNHVAVLISRAVTNKLGVAVINTNDRDICADPGSARQVCDIFVGDLGMGLSSDKMFGFSIYDTARSGVSGKVIAVTSNLPGGGACVIDFTRTDPATDFTITTLFEKNSVTKQAVLADIEGQGCPSLIDAASSPMGARQFKASGVPGTCTLAGSSSNFTLPIGQFAVGAVRIDQVGGTLSPYARDALVTTDGIFAIRTGGIGLTSLLYTSDRPLTAATSADIDADGDLDIIAISQGAEDLDVIQRVPGDNFLRLRLDTVGAVTMFAASDFDGNGIADVAYTELFVDSQRLSIAYGTRDRPLAPVDAGAFANIVGLVPIQTKDSTDPHKVVDDLIVLDIVDPTQVTPVMTLLHGSPQRTMQSFFDPRGVNANTVFMGVAAGQFFPTSTGEHYIDLVAIDGSRYGSSTVWPLAGTSYGAFSYTSSIVFTPKLGSCRTPPTDLGLAAPAPDFCTDSASYVTWSRDNDNDIVIGVDHGSAGRKMVVFDPLDPGTQTSAPTSTLVVEMFPFDQATLATLEVRSMRPADLDGDGHRELIISFAPPDLLASAGAILHCDVTADGKPTSCIDLAAEIPALAGLGCVDAVVAKVRPTGTPTPPADLDQPSAPAPTPDDLVVVCHRNEANTGTMSEMFRVYSTGDGFQADSLGEQPGSIEVLRAGDVTGDGLDDLLGIRVNRTTGPTLVVFPQCASSDGDCGAEAIPADVPE